VIRRVTSLVVLIWVLGFAVFTIALPQPASDAQTDAIVVPTGAPGRIARGLALLEAGKAKRMLITGVDRKVQPKELAVAQNVPLRWLSCCVDLGREAVDTRSNGAETARWVAQHRYRSVRLVTSDWHMPRAHFELERALGNTVTILPDAVRGEPDLLMLLTEYNKYLVRRAAVLVGL